MASLHHGEDELELFKRQVLQLVDPKELQWPSRDALRSLDIQSRIYRRLFQSEHPPPERYQLRVLKRLLSLIEESIVDPEQDVGEPFATKYRHCQIYYSPRLLLRLTLRLSANHRAWFSTISSFRTMLPHLTSPLSITMNLFSYRSELGTAVPRGACQLKDCAVSIVHQSFFLDNIRRSPLLFYRSACIPMPFTPAQIFRFGQITLQLRLNILHTGLMLYTRRSLMICLLLSPTS